MKGVNLGHVVQKLFLRVQFSAKEICRVQIRRYEGVGNVCCGSGMSHILSPDRLQYHLSIVVLFFLPMRSCFVRATVQSSSHI